MNSDLKAINSTGFYLTMSKEFIKSYGLNENGALCAYNKSTERRLHSPGIASEAIVVGHLFGGKIKTQYVYLSIYDAMRQILAFKETESRGEIKMCIYSDTSGLEVIREWKYNIEGYRGLDGDYIVEYAGWEQQ